MIFPKIALTLYKCYSDNYSEVKSCKLINTKLKQQIFVNIFSLLPMVVVKEEGKIKD